MARYISTKIINNIKYVVKIHSTDQSKDFWYNLDNDLEFISINEEQFKKIKYNMPFEIDSNNNINFHTYDAESFSMTEEKVQEKLKEHIKKVKHHIKNHEVPLLSQADLDSLQSIDTSGITWPVNTQSPNGWVEALELSSNTIDNIYEV